MEGRALGDFQWVLKNLYAASGMFAKCCGFFIENSFALFSFFNSKIALKRTQVIGIKQIKFSTDNSLMIQMRNEAETRPDLYNFRQDT